MDKAFIKKHYRFAVFYSFTLLIPLLISPMNFTSARSLPLTLDYESFTLNSKEDRYSFVTTADLNSDGRLEIIVSVFPEIVPTHPRKRGGKVLVLTYSERGGVWQTQEFIKKEDNIMYPNEVSAEDMDGDGDLDLIVPYGFLACPRPCGGLLWLENRGGDWRRHDIVDQGSSEFFHKALLADFNGNGRKELLTVGEKAGPLQESESHTYIFSDTAYGTQKELVGEGGGSFPSVIDMDNDGDLDIASAQYFTEGDSAIWFENHKGSWKPHRIHNRLGGSIQFSIIPDLLRSEGLIGVLSNHTNTNDDSHAPRSGLYLLRPNKTVTRPWVAQKISSGIESVASPVGAPQAAPGIFHWGDLDNDGDLDIVLSGDGDPRIFLLEQKKDESFQQHTLLRNSPQSGVHIADLDNDGVLEIIVSSYEKRELKFLKLRE